MAKDSFQEGIRTKHWLVARLFRDFYQLILKSSDNQSPGVVEIDTKAGKMRQVLLNKPLPDGYNFTKQYYKSIHQFADRTIFLSIDSTMTKPTGFKNRPYTYITNEDNYIVNPNSFSIENLGEVPDGKLYDSGIVVLTKKNSGLSGNGTFLYNLVDSSENRLARFTDLQAISISPDGLYWLYERQAKGDKGLYRYSASDGVTVEIAQVKNRQKWRYLRHQRVSIGTEFEAKSPWDIVAAQSPLVVNPEQPAQGGRFAVENMYKNSSPEIQQLAADAYDRILKARTLIQFIDPVSGAKLMVEESQRSGSAKFDSLFLGTDFTSAVDKDKVYKYAYGYVMGVPSTSENIASASPEDLARVECFFGKVYNLTSSDFDSYQGSSAQVAFNSKFMRECRDGVESSDSPAPQKQPEQSSPEKTLEDDIKDKAKKKFKKLIDW